MSDFIDKVKLGITKGVATASVKSKEFLDITKLKNQISNLQNKKRLAIEELGHMTYAMYLKENIDQDIIKDKCKSIAKIDDQVKALENEIVEVQQKAREFLGEDAPANKCSCGADISEETKFCSACGRKVERMFIANQPEKASASESICAQCQEKLEIGSKFCPKCGAKVL